MDPAWHLQPTPSSAAPTIRARGRKRKAWDRRSGFAPLTEPPSNDPEFIKASKAWPGVPVVLPNGEHIEDPKSPTHYVMAPFPKLESVVEAARRARSEIQAVKTTNPTLTPLIAAAKLYDALHRYLDHGGDFDYQRQPNKDQKGRIRTASSVPEHIKCECRALLPTTRVAACHGIGSFGYFRSRVLKQQ